MRLAEGTRALPRPRQQFGVIENTQCLLKETAGGDKARTQKEYEISHPDRRGAVEVPRMGQQKQ